MRRRGQTPVPTRGLTPVPTPGLTPGRSRGPNPVRYDRSVTFLVHTGQPHDADMNQLRARIAELEVRHADRVNEIGRVRSELGAFKTRYRDEVGLLHEELDELEEAIAAAEAGHIEELLKDAGDRDASASGAPRAETQARFTSDGVRRLFRDVAKAIHPDLAHDEFARDRRHSLMIEANRAYAMGDEERLRWILEAWQRSPEAVQGDDPAAARLRLERRIAQLEEQLQLCNAELESLKDTALWKLKAMVDESAARGTNLIRDMVRRLQRDILVARNRLEAMQPQS